MPLPPIAAPVVCEVSLSEYEEILDEATVKLETDSEAFRAAAGEAMEKLPCLHDSLLVEQVADLHFVLGLLMAEERDDIGARRAFCSVFSVAPEYPVPQAFEVQSDFNRHRVSIAQGRECARTALGGRPLVAPAGTAVLIDGRERIDRPVDRPYLVQLIWESDGDVHFTGYLSAESYELDLTPYAPPPPPPRPERLIPRWHPAAALAATAGAAALYRLAWGAQLHYVDPAVADNPEEYEPYAQQNRSFTLAAAGVGAVAVGLDVWLIARSLQEPRYEGAP